MQDAFAVPPEQDESAGEKRPEDVEKRSHGSALQAFKVLVDGAGVLEVVGVGLQLVCVMVLEPQGVVGVVTPHFVCPAVAEAFDGVLAILCVELIGNHLLTFLIESNSC